MSASKPFSTKRAARKAYVDDPLRELAAVLLLHVLEVGLVLLGEVLGVQEGDDDCGSETRSVRSAGLRSVQLNRSCCRGESRANPLGRLLPLCPTGSVAHTLIAVPAFRRRRVVAASAQRVEMTLLRRPRLDRTTPSSTFAPSVPRDQWTH